MRRLIILVGALVALLSGCGSTNSTGASHDTHILRWGIIGQTDVQTLDPALATDPTSISVSSMVFGGLVKLDSHLRVQPDGASSWTISRDGTVYTFHLRPHLRFADGKSVTAADFAGSLRRALGPQAGSGTADFYLSLIRRQSTKAKFSAVPGYDVRVLNPVTLRIRLSQPAAQFMAELAFPSSHVVELSQVQRLGQNWTDHAVGFGPYYVQEWRHSRFLRLQANPYFYGGSPTIRTIMLQFYAGQQSAFVDYSSGRLDLVTGWQAGQSVEWHGNGINRVPGLAQDYLSFNTLRLPFHRLGARRAFAAVFRPSLVTNVMHTAAFRARGFIPSAFGMRTQLPRLRRSATAFMARAHYPGGRGFPSVTLVVPRDPLIYAVARAMVIEWERKLSVTIGIRELNLSDYATVLNSRNYDFAVVRWGADYPDLHDFLGTQLGSSPDNVTGWSAPAYSDAIVLADSYNPNDVRRSELYREAATLAATNVPLLPLDEPALTAVVAPYVSGVRLTPLGTIVGVWTQARISP